MGHGAAILTVVLAALSPFVLFGWFVDAIGGMGLSVHPAYSGGEVSHSITRPGYRILVYRRVGKTTPWQRIEPFVQMRWTPARNLPVSVSDEVDVDGDGKADIRVNFRPAEAVVDAVPLDARHRAVHSKGVSSFSRLIARVNDSIVVRLPLD
jgi:hypothetical protein